MATWGEGGCGVLLTSITYLWAPSVQEVSVCEGGLDRTKARLSLLELQGRGKNFTTLRHQTAAK